MGGQGSTKKKLENPPNKASCLTREDCETMIARWRSYEAERYARLADQLERMMAERTISYSYPGGASNDHQIIPTAMLTNSR